MNQSALTNLIYPAFCAALISVMGFISIPLPFSPVPITGQTLAIMLTGTLLKPKLTFWSLTIYLLLGAVGLPVFAGFSGGIGAFTSPSGGYLISYLPGAVLISLLKGSSNTLAQLALANLLGGIGIVYLIGVPWLAWITDMSMGKALSVGFLPFILGDFVKLCMAVLIGQKLHRHLEQLHNS